jgi:hypothetical protein
VGGVFNILSVQIFFYLVLFFHLSGLGMGQEVDEWEGGKETHKERRIQGTVFQDSLL